MIRAGKFGAAGRSAPWPRNNGIGLALSALCALGIVAVLAFFGASAWQSRQAALRGAARATANMAHVLEEHTVRILEANDWLLTHLIDRVGEPDWDRLQHSRVLWHELVASLNSLPSLQDVYLADAEGKARFGTPDFPGPGMDIADRNYFKAMRTRDPGLYIGTLIKGRASQRYGIPLVRRLQSRDGRFTGIGVATIDAEFLRHFYERLDMAHEPQFELIREDLSVLVSQPMPPGDPLASRKGADFVAASREADRGTYQAVSPVDGIDRIVSFRKVQNLPLFVTASVSADAVLKDWRRGVAGEAIFVLLAVSMIGTTGWFAWQRSRSETARQLALAAANMTLERRVAERTAELEVEQAALSDSEARYRAVVETAADAIVALDEQGCIASVNAATERLFGYPSGELAGRDIRLLLPAADGDDRNDGLARRLRDAAAGLADHGRGDMAGRRKDGTSVPVSLSVGAYQLDGKRFLTVIVRDVTERRLAERQRHEHERRIADIAANLPGIIYRRVLYPDGRLGYRYASSGVEALFGVPASTYMAAGPVEAHLARLVPEDRREWREALERSAATLEPFAVESRIDTGNGVRWVRSVAQPYREDDGTVVWDGVSLDVTERKLAEQALQESEQRFKDVARMASDWIWETDAENRHVYLSDRLSEFTGLPNSYYLGRRCEDIVAEALDPEAVAGHVDDLRARRPFRDFTYWVDRPSGRRCFRLNGKPRFDRAGRFRGYRGTGKDVTEQKRSEQERTLLMAELDHRVKNTLATVNSILGQTMLTSESPQAFAEAFQGRVRALSRTHDLLTQSKWRGADLRQIVREELLPFEEADGDSVVARGEALFLKARAALAVSMALHELATNAAKYGALSAPEGRLEVVWSVEDGADGKRLMLRWRESGGPPVRAPSRRGFGSMLLEQGIAYELGGSTAVTYHNAGVHCEIAIPAEQLEETAVQRSRGWQKVSRTDRAVNSATVMAKGIARKANLKAVRE